jgi:hypothetical protein
MRVSRGVTVSMVIIVLPAAINSSAARVVWAMVCLSSSTLWRSAHVFERELVGVHDYAA